MATFPYTPPPAPTSVGAITITQTLTRLDGPVTTTFITLTTLTLSKPTPTSDQSSQARPQSGLSPSAIGAILGSLLGFILLIALIYFCCSRTPDDDDDSELEDAPRPVRRHTRPATLGPDDDVEVANAHIHQVEPETFIADDTELEHAPRPVRKHRRPVMLGPGDHVHQVEPMTLIADDNEMGVRSGQHEVVMEGGNLAVRRPRPRRKRKAPLNRAHSRHG